MASQYGINHMDHILLNTFVKLLNKSVNSYRPDYDGLHIVNSFCDKGPQRAKRSEQAARPVTILY
ncbi:MAG: hypothetical protein Barrevirus18_1 [Barrevirus sp.]|uniref:Uncharacterized protein n=1 Tax=Barrevirus sp. TaxID=2487763 RepID=A0A3G4ZQM7_9VIRU|nr:MAG: hypothetical protein Barrevirus18_1 [Barrevirus sp.]